MKTNLMNRGTSVFLPELFNEEDEERLELQRTSAQPDIVEPRFVRFDACNSRESGFLDGTGHSSLDLTLTRTVCPGAIVSNSFLDLSS